MQPPLGRVSGRARQTPGEVRTAVGNKDSIAYWINLVGLIRIWTTTRRVGSHYSRTLHRGAFHRSKRNSGNVIAVPGEEVSSVMNAESLVDMGSWSKIRGCKRIFGCPITSIPTKSSCCNNF